MTSRQNNSVEQNSLDDIFDITTLDIKQILSATRDLTNIFFVHAHTNDVTHVAPFERI